MTRSQSPPAQGDPTSQAMAASPTNPAGPVVEPARPEGRVVEAGRPEGRVVEPARPLSESMLWRVQRQYFDRSGAAAWASGDVPHVLTTSPAMARMYASVIEGYAEDCAAGRLGAVEPSEPLYVVELGAGSGRLGFNIARALGRARLAMPVVYVLTDLAESNAEFWRSHPQLRPLIEAGAVDTAIFDATKDGEIRLERSGAVLAPGRHRNPIGVVANYLFDVIPQDLFASRDGVPVEQLVAVVEGEGGLDADDPGFFGQAWLATSERGCPPVRYGDAFVDGLLAAAAAGRPGERFLFPAAGLACLERLRSIAGGRLLLLCGERPGGLPPEPEADAVEALRPDRVLALAVHGGSFSLPVDREILTSGLRAHGATVLVPEAEPAVLALMAVVAGGNASSTRRRFELATDGAGPEDIYLALRPILDRGADEVPLAQLLAICRTSGYDPYILPKLMNGFTRALAELGPDDVAEAVRVLERLADLDFSIDRHSDAAGAAAQLLARTDHVEEALRLFATSRRVHGPDARVAYGEAVCLLRLEDVAAALERLEEAVALDPEATPAAELRAKVIAEIERRRGAEGRGAEGRGVEGPGAEPGS